MSSPTWGEYLAEAKDHLLAARRSAEVGSAPPAVQLERPTDPIPDEYRGEARRLADGYDQLAVEVTSRMAVIASRPALTRRSLHQEHRPASYIDTDV